MNFLSYEYFKFFIKQKTENPLKICLVYRLADENAYLSPICHSLGQKH